MQHVPGVHLLEYLTFLRGEETMEELSTRAEQKERKVGTELLGLKQFFADQQAFESACEIGLDEIDHSLT